MVRYGMSLLVLSRDNGLAYAHAHARHARHALLPYLTLPYLTLLAIIRGIRIRETKVDWVPYMYLTLPYLVYLARSRSTTFPAFAFQL